MMDVGSNKSRKDARAVISLVARYRSPSTFEYVQEACCDVSVGGMFIKSPDPAAAGTLLKLECEADRDGGGKIRGVARVVWLRREANEYGPSGMGVKFVKLETGSKETITRIVEDLAAAGVEPSSISSAPEARGKPRGSVRVGSPLPAALSTAVIATPPAPSPTEKASPSADASKPASAKIVAEPAPEPAPAPAPAPVSAAPTQAPQPSEPEPPPPTAATPEPAPAPAHEARAPMASPMPSAQNLTRAIEQHEARTVPGPQRSAPLEIAPEKAGNSRRAIWLVGVAAAALLVYIFTDEARKPRNDSASPAASAPVAPVAHTEEPKPEPAKTAEPAPPPTAASPTAEEKPSEPATTAATSAEARVENPSQPSGAPEEKEKPAAKEAAAQPSTNDTTVADEARVAATLPSERPALPPGQMPYVMTFITTPTGASVTIGTQTVVAPGDIDLGLMPARVRVTAVKDGYEPTSAWLDHSEFAKAPDGKIRRRVYLKLQPLAQPGAAPKAAPSVVPAAAAAPKPATPAAPAAAAAKPVAPTATPAVPPKPAPQAPVSAPTAAAPKPAAPAPATPAKP